MDNNLTHGDFPMHWTFRTVTLIPGCKKYSWKLSDDQVGLWLCSRPRPQTESCHAELGHAASPMAGDPTNFGGGCAGALGFCLASICFSYWLLGPASGLAEAVGEAWIGKPACLGITQLTADELYSVMWPPWCPSMFLLAGLWLELMCHLSYAVHAPDKIL